MITDKALDRYKLIIDEWFVNGFNGTKAYEKYYPDVKRSGDAFFKLQRFPDIQNYIKQKKDKAQRVLKTKHDAILDELVRWAYSDITETILLTPKQVKKLPIEVRRLITKFKTTTKTFMVRDTPTKEVVIELHFVSKEKAMEMIQKHTGFYGKHNAQKTQETTTVKVEFVDFSQDVDSTE